MLNPIIYVTFHQDFRRAFKYLLCLQCSTMGSRLRAEAYISQYGGSLAGGHHLNGNNNNNGATNGKGGTASSRATLRANASWGQLDERIVAHGGFGETHDHHKPRAQFQQTFNSIPNNQQLPLFPNELSGSTAGEESDDFVVTSSSCPPVTGREYELTSLPSPSANNSTVTGNGIPVSLLVTTFALTHTTTTTSARMPPSSASSSTIAIADAEGDDDLVEPVTGEYINHPNSIDTASFVSVPEDLNAANAYASISIEIDPKSHQATITRSSISS